jgi:hypothetical protein
MRETLIGPAMVATLGAVFALASCVDVQGGTPALSRAHRRQPRALALGYAGGYVRSERAADQRRIRESGKPGLMPLQGKSPSND